MNEEECELFARGLANAANLHELDVSISTHEDRAFEHLFRSFHGLKRLKKLSICLLVPFVGPAGAMQLYQYVKQTKSLEQLTLRHRNSWVRGWIGEPTRFESLEMVPFDEKADFAGYAIAKGLAHNSSIKVLKFHSRFNHESEGYLGFEKDLLAVAQNNQATRKQENPPKPKVQERINTVAVVLGDGLSSNQCLEELSLAFGTVDDEAFGKIFEPVANGQNQTLKCIDIDDDPHDVSLSITEKALLKLVRKSTSLEEIKRKHEELYGLRPQLLNEEVRGWLHLNENGCRRAFMEGSMDKRACVDLLTKTKENTTCAFGLLRAKPSAFFS